MHEHGIYPSKKGSSSRRRYAPEESPPSESRPAQGCGLAAAAVAVCWTLAGNERDEETGKGRRMKRRERWRGGSRRRTWRRRRTRRRPPRGRGGGREESLPNVRGSSGSGSGSNVGREGLGLAFSSVHAAAVFGPRGCISISISIYLNLFLKQVITF